LLKLELIGFRDLESLQIEQKYKTQAWKEDQIWQDKDQYQAYKTKTKLLCHSLQQYST